MSDYLMKDAAIATIRCFMLIIGNKSVLKSLITLAYVSLLTAIFMMQPSSLQAQDSSNINASSEKIMSEMKERLKLTDEQETKIRPIIEDSLQRRSEILANSSKDRKTALQELQWSTDMQLGKILTEEQMKEYEKLREEQSEKMQHSDMQRSRGSRIGGFRGF